MAKVCLLCHIDLITVQRSASESSDDEHADDNYGLGKDFTYSGAKVSQAVVNGNSEEVNNNADHEPTTSTEADDMTNTNCDHDLPSTPPARSKIISRRPSYIRQDSTITLPEVLDDSDNEDYEYSDTNKSSVSKTIVVRTQSTEVEGY